MVHSDDFRWFGDKKDLNEWDALIKNFNKHKYKVTDCSDKEFVGIRIKCDENYNYFMNQTRMVEEIIDGIGMKNAKHESSFISRSINVWYGTYISVNNVRTKCIVPIR